ncbi:MAG TPA: type II secretion system protein [Methylophilus sp.]
MLKRKGFTLIELIVTVAIVALLASAAMPLLQLSVQRNKEHALRSHLRQMREAIDAYKKAADEGRVKKSADESGYPPTLTVLVDGVEDLKDPNKAKLKFLRRIPADPMQTHDQGDVVNAAEDWGLRSYDSDADRPQAGKDVYDVYSLSPLTGSNGIPYAQW